MTLTSVTDVANTQHKLSRLEARYEVLRRQTGGNERVRDLTMTSLKRLINQLKEEIAIYNIRQPARQ